MKIAIIGSGLMGQGLVQIFSQCEAVEKIVWIGRNKESVHLAYNKLILTWEKLVAKGKFAKEITGVWQSKLVESFVLEDVAGASLVVEAITENLEAKKELFEKLSRIADKDALLVSNTSSMSITEIGSVARRPENILGMHFFNPPAVMKLVEIVVGAHTSEASITRAKEISAMLNKRAIEVKETPGFVVNRMLIPMINEAIGLLAEGIASAPDIDQAMQLGANHPIGPLALADFIGNDVVLAIMDTLRTETGDPKYRPHPMLRKLVRAGKLGRKTNEGFFKY